MYNYCQNQFVYVDIPILLILWPNKYKTKQRLLSKENLRDFFFFSTYSPRNREVSYDKGKIIKLKNKTMKSTYIAKHKYDYKIQKRSS